MVADAEYEAQKQEIQTALDSLFSREEGETLAADDYVANLPPLGPEATTAERWSILSRSWKPCIVT